MMTLLNTIRTAFNGIMGNKLRAALTTLGIVIGLPSVLLCLLFCSSFTGSRNSII